MSENSSFSTPLSTSIPSHVLVGILPLRMMVIVFRDRDQSLSRHLFTRGFSTQPLFSILTCEVHRSYFKRDVCIM